MTSNETNQLYEEAVQSLKNINNQLFYDELKNNLEKHENKMEREYQKVQKLLEGWKTTIEAVPANLSLKVEEVNKQVLDFQEGNLESIKEDVIALFTQKQNDFVQILTSMGKFQNNLHTIYKYYKDLYDKQNGNYETQMVKVQTLLDEFQQEVSNVVVEGFSGQKQISDNQTETITSELKSLLEGKFQDVLSAIHVNQQKTISTMEEMMQRLEAEKKEHEAMVHGQFQAFTEIATTTAVQQDEATQQLVNQIETQSKQTEQKYTSLKKFVIALSVGQALLLGSIWYLGL